MDLLPKPYQSVTICMMTAWLAYHWYAATVTDLNLHNWVAFQEAQLRQDWVSMLCVLIRVVIKSLCGPQKIRDFQILK